LLEIYGTFYLQQSSLQMEWYYEGFILEYSTTKQPLGYNKPGSLHEKVERDLQVLCRTFGQVYNAMPAHLS
jgi:hypothetical protein